MLVAFGDLQTYLVAGRRAAGKPDAGGRQQQGVYQVFMRRPGPSPAEAFADRFGQLWQSWRRLALPQLLSLADFRSLPDLRIIRLLPAQTRARRRRSV